REKDRPQSELALQTRPPAHSLPTDDGVSLALGLVRTALVPVLLLSLTLLGLSLRLRPLVVNRLREDEALYASWALLIATGKDPGLLSVAVDKPPFFIYLLALCFRLFGGSEAVARLPNLIASTLALPLLYALGLRLYGHRVALLASAFFALSPFAILFAPTVYTDPWLLTWTLTAAVAAVHRRWGWAGVGLGLACATKQQGVFFLPLVIGLGWASSLQPGEQRQTWQSRLTRLALGMALPLLLMFWWDARRWHVQPGFLDRSLQTYAPLTLVPWQALPERATDWLTQASYLTASPWLDGLLLAGQGQLLLPKAQVSRADWVLVGWSGAYMLLHLLVSFSVWDRYLLGLTPVVALLLARILERLTETVARRAVTAHLKQQLVRIFFPVLVLVVMLLGPAMRAARSGYPVGGDHGAYDGIDLVADHLQVTLPPSFDQAIVYHRWLGWHYRYYLFGAPYEFRWWPEAYKLARDVLAHLGEVQVIVFPGWHLRERDRVQQVLAGYGLGLRETLRTYRRDGTLSFIVYRIEQLPATANQLSALSLQRHLHLQRTPAPRSGAVRGVQVSASSADG
ncbi:MAG TPA: phospholipid carrier-dependent glycosyltransferase, partial [Anaerolineae bacterium]|nr:phospholipid carrier-dependent glycosyltransferase [Anaerolineae bacterium]